jgi:hypothetical protein
MTRGARGRIAGPALGADRITIDAAGAVSNAGAIAYHGMMSEGKDMYVRVKSHSGPRYSIGISVKLRRPPPTGIRVGAFRMC